jgi:hypothetical protein
LSCACLLRVQPDLGPTRQRAPYASAYTGCTVMFLTWCRNVRCAVQVCFVPEPAPQMTIQLVEPDKTDGLASMEGYITDYIK